MIHIKVGSSAPDGTVPSLARCALESLSTLSNGIETSNENDEPLCIPNTADSRNKKKRDINELGNADTEGYEPEDMVGSSSLIVNSPLPITPAKQNKGKSEKKQQQKKQIETVRAVGTSVSSTNRTQNSRKKQKFGIVKDLFGEDVFSMSDNEVIDHGSAKISDISKHIIQDEKPTLAEAVVVTRGQVPQKRWGSSATVIFDPDSSSSSEQQLLVFGGQCEMDPVEQCLKDAHIISLSTDSKREASPMWKSITECSEGLAFHTATYVPNVNNVVIFGGVNEAGTESAKLYAYDTILELFYPLNHSGKVPAARMGHTASLLKESMICIFGGSRKGKWFNDVHLLDCNKWRWSTPNIFGIPPEPRTYHQAVSISDNEIVIFGGNGPDRAFNDVHVLTFTNEENCMWSQPDIKGIPPASRCGHISLTVIDPKTKIPHVLVYGGWDTTEKEVVDVYGDAFLLNSKTWEWKQILLPLPKLTGMAGDMINKSNNNIVLFGGQTSPPESNRSNTLYSFHVFQ